MIFIKKSNDIFLQKILDKAREKDNENIYRSGDVFDKIKADFHSKCYICEDNEMTSIQIEHFDPHKNDLFKKYDWNNLWLYMDSKVFLTRVESKEESRALPRFLTL